MFSIHIHTSASQYTVTNTAPYHLAVLPAIHITRSILSYRKGNNPYCHHTHRQIKSITVRTQYSGFTLSAGFVSTHSPNHKCIQASWYFFSSLLRRLVLYGGHTKQVGGTAHGCSLLQSCRQGAWTPHLTHTALQLSGELSLARTSIHRKQQQFPKVKRVVKLKIGYPSFLREKISQQCRGTSGSTRAQPASPRKLTSTGAPPPFSLWLWKQLFHADQGVCSNSLQVSLPKSQ